MYTIKAIELFNSGSEEINRKKIIIKKIFGILDSLINNYLSSLFNSLETNKKEWEEKRDLPAVQFSNFKFVVEYRSKRLYFSLLNNSDDWWLHRDPPAKSIPEIYKCLPEIIEALANYFPKAKIYEYFNFFIKQAP